MLRSAAVARSWALRAMLFNVCVVTGLALASRANALQAVQTPWKHPANEALCPTCATWPSKTHCSVPRDEGGLDQGAGRGRGRAALPLLPPARPAPLQLSRPAGPLSAAALTAAHAVGSTAAGSAPASGGAPYCACRTCNISHNHARSEQVGVPHAHEERRAGCGATCMGLAVNSVLQCVEQLCLTANTRLGAPFVQRCAPGGKGIGGHKS